MAELMVALVIAGLIGVALTRLVISQTRFIASQDGMMRARAVARSGLAVMADELRQVSWNGVASASRDSLSLRIPFAFGVVCGQSGGSTIVAIMPPDSARYATAVNAGYAWRDSNGVWAVVEPATRAHSPNGICLAAIPQVTAPEAPSGVAYTLAVTPNVVATPVGGIVYLYTRIVYALAPSGELPGRVGLWREVVGSGNGPEELVAPFDTSSRFDFLVGPLLVSQTAVPAVLDSIRGVRVKLMAASEQPPPGRPVPSRFLLTSNLVFRNREF